MEDKNVETVVLDKDAVDAIANAVGEKVNADVKASLNEIDEKVNEAVEKAMETKEEVIAKNVKGVPSLIKGGSPENEAKEVRLVKAVRAMLSKDYGMLKEYNAINNELLQKAGYNSSNNNADGAYVVLDPEFEAEVERLTEVYGVAVNEVSVRRINSDSVKTNKRGSNVAMYEIGQGASITASKLTIEQMTGELRKFAGLAISTNELNEDQAVDFYAELVDGFAEESARIQDVQVFTDTNATYPGIANLDNTYAETVGAAITDITWDDLLNAQYKVPTRAGMNGKFYMHRTIWNLLLQVKDSESRYQFTPAQGLTTPWGTPVVLVDVMNDVAHVADANEPYVIFGDLKRTKMYIKRGLVMDQSMDATVVDSESATVNLFQQDMQGLRVKKRELVLHKFPEAYCLIGTGTVS
jgi:HK97 family phage major capsid protein